MFSIDESPQSSEKWQECGTVQLLAGAPLKGRLLVWADGTKGRGTSLPLSGPYGGGPEGEGPLDSLGHRQEAPMEMATEEKLTVKT